MAFVIGFFAVAVAPAPRSPVQTEHLQKIQALFQAGGLKQASVALDSRGRVELKGAYEDEPEVARAFSLAQTVVGVQWVSPITPEQIKVRAWISSVESFFGARQPPPDTTVAAPETRAADPPGPVRAKYALLAGVGQFQDGHIRHLQYPAKDAADIYQYLVDPSGGNFPPENVVLLRDAQVTRSAVVEALDGIKAKAGPDDLVLVYLSSHGTPPDMYGGVHVVTYDAVVKPREKVWQTSVSEDILRSFIQGVRTKRLIIVLDACYSNGAYAKVPGFLPPGGKSLEADADEGAGRSQRYMAQRLLGMKDLTYEPPAAPASPKTVRQSWGKVLISASDAGERSWESDTLHNSIFTHYFLEGLVRTRGSVKAAFEYARPLVREQVKREKGTDIEQTPQVTPNRSEWDISFTTRS
jgi:hypothetical protein